jgi:molybdopterin-dependent oxidoreductase-like protein protein
MKFRPRRYQRPRCSWDFAFRKKRCCPGCGTLLLIASDVPTDAELNATKAVRHRCSSTILNFVGVRPEAKYVVYFSLDEAWWDSLDMPDAFHPQTLLASGMNGRELPTGHGAPVRMRVARQLGYKSVKHLKQITVTNTLKNVGDGRGAPGLRSATPGTPVSEPIHTHLSISWAIRTSLPDPPENMPVGS